MASFYGGIGIINGSGGGSGVSIANIEFDANRNLIIYLSDGSKRNLGQIDGATFTPTIINGNIRNIEHTNLSINKKIKVCCNSNETIAVASVPSVLSGVDGETPTDTETPIILNGTISVTKIY